MHFKNVVKKAKQQPHAHEARKHTVSHHPQNKEILWQQLIEPWKQRSTLSGHASTAGVRWRETHFCPRQLASLRRPGRFSRRLQLWSVAPLCLRRKSDRHHCIIRPRNHAALRHEAQNQQNKTPSSVGAAVAKSGKGEVSSGKNKTNRFLKLAIQKTQQNH